ncbi:hypothetical protein AB0L40_21625 [Patulibacter sp. NPDC049589]|uniref:hypothetical protein n=1 Tax=Patulibacter sp. NPDC049589 TaxID=3154731 RepID=UPI00342A1350
MSRLPLSVPGAALACTLLLPSAALANRPATPAEQTALLRDLGVAASGTSCSAFLVSTVPAGTDSYARIEGISPDPPGCLGGGTTFVIARSTTGPNGPWLPVIPGRVGALNGCADAGVPDDVGQDLAACTPSGAAPRDARSRTTLGCFPTAGAKAVRVQRRKPTRCLVRRAVGFDAATAFVPATSASGFDLRGLRWKGWGSGRATATGTGASVQGATTARRRVAVRVTASEVRTDGGRLFYTRLKVRTPTTTSTLMLSWPF